MSWLGVVVLIAICPDSALTRAIVAQRAAPAFTGAPQYCVLALLNTIDHPGTFEQM